MDCPTPGYVMPFSGHMIGGHCGSVSWTQAAVCTPAPERAALHRCKSLHSLIQDEVLGLLGH